MRKLLRGVASVIATVCAACADSPGAPDDAGVREAAASVDATSDVGSADAFVDDSPYAIGSWCGPVYVRPDSFGSSAWIDCKGPGQPRACCTGPGTGVGCSGAGYPACERVVPIAAAANVEALWISGEFTIPSNATPRAGISMMTFRRSDSTSAPSGSTYTTNTSCKGAGMPLPCCTGPGAGQCVTENTCFEPNAKLRGQATSENLAQYVTAARAAAAAAHPGRPFYTIITDRTDVLGWPALQIDGMDCSWLADSETPWGAEDGSTPNSFMGFLRNDTSPDCGPSKACTWSNSEHGESPAWDGRDVGVRFSDQIDALCGATGAYKSKIYYLTRRSAGQRRLSPNAVVMRLDDPKYEAWRARLAKLQLQTSGADFFDLNDKFHQYGSRLARDACTGPKTPFPCCTGSGVGPSCTSYFQDVYPNVTAFGGTATTASAWTGRPKGYDYSKYVQGWKGMADALRAEGVRYSLMWGAGGWDKPGSWDDPSTPLVDEDDLIRQVVHAASFVIAVTGGYPQAAGDALIADLTTRTIPFVTTDPRCEQYPTPKN